MGVPARALALAGLAYHARQKGTAVELTLVDPDIIEEGNVGRQQFGVASALAGDVPKACDLALRLNAAYGLAITAWPVPYEADMARAWFHQQHYQVGNGRQTAHLLIGCVDNYRARRELAQTVENFHGRVWALDSGNDRWSGQVLIGNLTDMSQLRLDRLGLCTGLPSPYIQEPDLLAPDPEEENQSCAEMALAETQSLMVNRMAAAIAAQYITGFVLHRQVVQMGTYFSLKPTVMTPRLVTAANLSLRS
ncbi:MAG TPA: hypothetical protein PLK31_01925 [Chloroflexota bacterium]|nr:hypothetical protein [Chloroflexota bacterium]